MISRVELNFVRTASIRSEFLQTEICVASEAYDRLVAHNHGVARALVVQFFSGVAHRRRIATGVEPCCFFHVADVFHSAVMRQLDTLHVCR